MTMWHCWHHCDIADTIVTLLNECWQVQCDHMTSLALCDIADTLFIADTMWHCWMIIDRFSYDVTNKQVSQVERVVRWHPRRRCHLIYTSWHRHQCHLNCTTLKMSSRTLLMQTFFSNHRVICYRVTVSPWMVCHPGMMRLRCHMYWRKVISGQMPTLSCNNQPWSAELKWRKSVPRQLLKCRLVLSGCTQL